METLEGIAKHNGPLTDREGNGIGRYASTGLPHAFAAYNEQQDLELWSHAGAEAQVAAIADDIAYDVHDLDDGIRARMFTLDDLTTLPLVGDAVLEVRTLYPNLEMPRAVGEVCAVSSPVSSRMWCWRARIAPPGLALEALRMCALSGTPSSASARR